MNLFTSYFAMASRLPNDYKAVSIALRSPDTTLWTMPDLVPTSGMLFDYKTTGNEEVYREHYNRIILGQTTPNAIWDGLKSLGSENVVLMCWERPESFCHRHLAAEWFTNAGYPVSELVFNKKGG